MKRFADMKVQMSRLDLQPSLEMSCKVVQWDLLGYFSCDLI